MDGIECFCFNFGRNDVCNNNCGECDNFCNNDCVHCNNDECENNTSEDAF